MLRPLRMVGADLSGKATAVAATHDPDGRPFLSVFTIPGTGGLPLHEQIARIERGFRRACGWGPGGTVWQPDVVVFEGTFSRQAAPAQDYALHALHANLKQWLWRRRIPYVDVAPSALKLWATGSGATHGVNKTTKDKVIAAIIAQYGRLITINPRDDNQCDAVAVLTLGLKKYGQPLTVTTAHQNAALRTPKWPVLSALTEQEAS